jgi:hypothetical protein
VDSWDTLISVCVTSRYLNTSVVNLPSNRPHVPPSSAESVHQQILVLARDHLTLAFADAASYIDVVQAIMILSLWKEPDDDKAAFYFNRVSDPETPLTSGRTSSKGDAIRPDTKSSRATSHVRRRYKVAAIKATTLVSPP